MTIGLGYGSLTWHLVGTQMCVAPPPSSCLVCPLSGWYFPRAQLCPALTSLSHSTCSLGLLGPVLRGTLSTDLEPSANVSFWCLITGMTGCKGSKLGGGESEHLDFEYLLSLFLQWWLHPLFFLPLSPSKTSQGS